MATQQLKEQTDAEREVEIHAGKAYYTDTGEFAYDTERPAFKVEDEATATWLMEKLSQMDGDLAGLAAQRAALVANIDSMVGDVKRARDGMERRYGPELTEYASHNLPTSKSGRVIKKTWTCPFGKVSFKDQAPRLVVEDEEKAIRWALDNGRGDAVKITEKFLVGQVDDAGIPGLAEVPAKLDVPKIKTGV